MKAILISEILESEEEIRPVLREHGIDLIHYRSPLKAMDNLSEISPDALIINAIDFPRHWKVIAQHIRWDKPQESVLLLLLTDDSFSEQDKEKAQESGVQAMIQVENSFVDALPEIKKAFEEYKKGGANYTLRDFSKAAQCVFLNPKNGVLITGTVKDISSEKIIFKADFPEDCLGLDESPVRVDCCLKIKDKTIESKCLLESNLSYLDLTFVELSAENKNLIDSI